MTDTWMLYGPTGYTGALIAQEAIRRGMRPVLAGRHAGKLAQLSAQWGLANRAFPLDDPQAMAAGLQGIRVVLHCAGPFSQTSHPMRQACMAAGVHYLDITGEIDVFVAAHDDDARARAAGVLLCPGVGFDVVPTDCVGATLKAALPDATGLVLGFSGLNQMSAGTIVTAMEAVHRGSARVRENGLIIDVPFGVRSRLADFGRGLEPTFVIPWGDVATAYYSTGIPNIEVHIPKHAPGTRAMRSLLPLRRLLASPALRRFVHRLLRTAVAGPSEAKRRQENTRVWGEARNAAGQVRTAVLEVMNGYTLTVETALLAVQRVLEGNVPPGYRTPSQLLGADCLRNIGCGIALQQAPTQP